MKKAYIILAHKNEGQLRRLIGRLDDGLSSFFIHIDKNSPLQKNPGMFMGRKNIQILPGIKTEWGGFGLVKITLNAMNRIRKAGDDYERIILLSGQDYPIKSNGQINQFFKSSNYSVFMEYAELPDYKKWGKNGGIYRINKYFFGFSLFYKYCAKTLNFMGAYSRLLQRKVKSDIKHFYGSQWWIMDSYALNYILNYVEHNPEYSAFHMNTFAPDELFFQTILLNSKDENILTKILNDNKRFIKWQDGSIAHPEILGKEDFNDIYHSEALFARKFDTTIDSEILEMIDEKCLADTDYAAEKVKIQING